jgi:exodeoxyribonuclease-3
MKIATWNINSVRIRIELIRKALQNQHIDILCLQETKTEDHSFPVSELQSLGFKHIYFSGQKSYNGMAILSNIPITDIHTTDFLNNAEKRHIGGKLENGTWLHNVYIPAGGDIPDVDVNPKFKDKLAFVDALTDWSSTHKKDKAIIVGDFNIAPYEHDVWSHKQLLGVVSHTPIETQKLERFRQSIEWVDVARKFVPMNEKLYSWWSYRNRDWEKSNRGRRLDHIWTTPDLEKSLKSYEVLRHVRGFESPSDHVPVVVEMIA